jgi:lipopolysaccharide O-acetyltransferase
MNPFIIASFPKQAIQKLVKLQRHETLLGLVNALALRFDQAFSVLLNRIIYGSPSLYVAGNLKIRGRNHIIRNGPILINGNAWIEAVYLYRGQEFSPRIELGGNLFASGSLHISCIGSISIGDNVLIGTNVYIGDHAHGHYGPDDQTPQSHPSAPPFERQLYSKGCIVIGSNVWIGNNVVILSPACIENGCIIGANSVVSGTFPASTIIAGSPARAVKSFDPEIQKWT